VTTQKTGEDSFTIISTSIEKPHNCGAFSNKKKKVQELHISYDVAEDVTNNRTKN
jgi:hypothetical protein